MKEENIECGFATNESSFVETDAKINLANKNVRGSLILTDNRLIFRSELIDLTKKFLLNKVHSVSLYKRWGLFNIGFCFLYEGTIYKLRVNYPNDWIKLIQEKIKGR